MTDEQRTKLDSKMHEFDSFNDFHDFAYENDIYFSNLSIFGVVALNNSLPSAVLPSSDAIA